MNGLIALEPIPQPVFKGGLLPPFQPWPWVAAPQVASPRCLILHPGFVSVHQSTGSGPLGCSSSLLASGRRPSGDSPRRRQTSARISTVFERAVRTISTETAHWRIVLCVIEPLALCRLAGGGRSIDGLFPAACPHPRDALAQYPTGQWGMGTCIKDDSKASRYRTTTTCLVLLRYVERNPVSAGLVERAQLWRWGSLWSRMHGEPAIKALLSPWPVERPANWTARVNTPLTAKELDRVRVSIERGRPYGGDDWVRQTVTDLGLERTVRPEGRPRKESQPLTDKSG